MATWLVERVEFWLFLESESQLVEENMVFDFLEEVHNLAFSFHFNGLQSNVDLLDHLLFDQILLLKIITN